MRQFGKEDSEEKTTCVREVGGEGRSSPRVPIGIRGRDATQTGESKTAL